MKRLTVMLCLVLAAGVAGGAKVYRQVQPDGTVIFTDKRPEGEVDEIRIRDVQTYNAPPITGRSTGTTDVLDEIGFEGYTNFAVVSPENEETVRDNNGVVPVQLSLDPALQRDHTVEIVMDGKVLGSGRSLSITLQSVDRGAHALEAKILAPEGQELARTEPTTFYLQRSSKLLP